MSSDVEAQVAPKAPSVDQIATAAQDASVSVDQDPANLLVAAQQAMPGESKESRSSERVRVRLRAVLITEKDGTQAKLHGHTADISGTGVSFVSKYAMTTPQPGTIFVMVDPGASTHPAIIIEAQCRLIVCVLSSQQGGFRIGLEFSKMSDESRKLLRKLLKDKQPS
ncbi:MAG: PilZ domain-containing protein [Proteobacteria bacterium]|nr:PilZ domain-containing protein [Pseudomonadota bacterium]